MLKLLALFALLAGSAVVQGVPCAKLAPGLDRMSMGVDLDTLDMKHDYSVDNVDGFVHRLIDFNCDKKKKWVSPFNNQEYDVPDEVEDMLALPTGMVFTDTLIYNDMNDVKTQRSKEVGLDISIGKFGFGASHSNKNAKEVIENQSKFLSENKAINSIAKANYIPADYLAKSLNTYVQDFINTKLPAKFEANPNAFYDLFRQYGTHYFNVANFGGQFLMSSEVDDRLRQTMDEKTIGNNAQFNFLTFLKLHGGWEKTVNAVDKAYSNNSISKAQYFGGQANLFETEGYKAWWPTVASNPWLYSGNLAPIFDIITGPKKAEVAKAFTAYFYHKYAADIRGTLLSFVGKGRTGDNIAQTYLQQLNAQDALVMPDLATLAKLEQEVKEYVLTPTWFKSATLCVHFEGDHCAASRMGTPAFKPCHQKEVCMTPAPTTFTLTAPAGTPAWFGQVRIEAQMTKVETPKYWNKHYMQFRVVVPETAPGWARNIQLCVTEAEGCDVAQNQQLCAQPNLFTGVFAFATKYEKKLLGLEKKKAECGDLSLRITTIN